MAPRRTRKAPQLTAEVADLEAFMATPLNPDLAQAALDHAVAAAEAEIKASLPQQLSHNLRQGILLLASQLVLAGDPEADLPIPLTCRFYWRLHASAAA